MKGKLAALLRRGVGPALFLACILYLGYHTVQGDRGLLAWLEMSDRVAALRVEVAEVRVERLVLEHRVSLLRPDSLDADMLEERVARVLNMARPGTRVLLERDNLQDSPGER